MVKYMRFTKPESLGIGRVLKVPTVASPGEAGLPDDRRFFRITIK